MNHETMLAFLMGQRRGGGSSGGGVSLPTLTNPAGADQILEGYEAVDGSGNKVTGTHVCESGGVGVAPQMDHGYGYLTFTTYDDEGVSAGRSKSLIEITGYDQTTISGSTSGSGYGYIYGHPEIVLHQKYATKYGQCIQVIWNTSATDFRFKAGETYTMVFLYHT